MTSFDNAHIRARKISLEGLGSRRDEEGIILAPDRNDLRLVLSEVSLPLGVGLYVGLVILEQMIELDLERAFSRHVVDIEIGAVGRDARRRLHSECICTLQTFG